jgi:RNA polymerase sigma-70 factor (ECF subfamily)
MIPEIGGIDNTLWEISDRNDNADSLLLYKDLVILIKQLPPLYRAVFNLYVIDAYTHVQIAETLNMPIGTSKSCLSRAKALLQDQLNKMESGKSCSI